VTVSSASRVVVVGAGLAGVKVVEGLRERGHAGEVVLVGEETDAPYDRPPLSKQVLRKEKDPFPLLDESLAVDFRAGVAAESLDLGARQVLTSAGVLSFDQLVIATGAQPRRLPGAPGLALRTLADCRALSDRLVQGARIAIVGAGLIGCEVAASARKLGVAVDVVDVLDGPLVRVLGPAVSARVRVLHESHEVEFHLGTGVAAADGKSLQLSDGTALEADVVLEAMGVTPTTGWLAGSGLDLDDGVICSETGVAADGVWAVGDVARWGTGHRHEHWTRATEQAAAVAAGILGEPTPVTVAPYWWSDQYDLKLQGVGTPSPDDEVVELEVGPRSRPLAVYSRDGRVTGAVGFSAAAAVMRLRDAVTDGTALDEALALVG
jgi:3-phenylpropionate/trans-cinnamate dioxygenase ferredoxin reductase subunit